MSGREREPRRRRSESPAARRSERVRRSTPQGKGKRSGGQPSARPRPKSRSSSGGAFKLSSTRRAAVLATVVCAMALSVSVPLRTYLSQRDELAHQQQREVELAREVQDLQQRKAELSDPAHVEAEARARLGYVRPGETPYIVEVPAPPPEAPPVPEQPGDGRAWYEQLWDSVTGKGQ